jgi:autotransporter-associated beta strand protein
LGVAVNGGGTVTFQNTNAYSTATTVTNGSTLIVNGSLPNSNVIVTGAFIGGNGQLSATPASLTLNGASALTAGSNLTVNGPTNVASGTFTIPAGATLSGNGGINVNPGAQLALNGSVDINQVVNMNSGLLSGSGTINGGLTNSGTSSISSGAISAAGAWTGSGAINVSSGAELLLGGAASTAGVTLNISGTLDDTGGGAVNGPVIVSGNGIATINVGTVPSFSAQGGTTNLAGATVNVATVSGSNAVVNVTAGSVPILNVVNSNLTSGVTIGPGASACTTSLTVSGGLVTMNDLDTIPTATLSGGTTNLAAPTVNVATISGSNTVVNATAGQLSQFSASGGTTTVGALVNAYTAAVTGSATVNLNNTNAMASFTASGGTTNFAGPTVPVAAISGTNTVVNITIGSVPTLNVTNSNPTSGVTVGAGASAGATALNVSGGLVTMNNSDTIPTATLSGGTINLSGPSVNLANISGSAQVKVNTGSVATLNASGSATTAVASSASVTNANVYGGLVNLNPTSGLTGLIVGGGRVNVSSTTALALLAVSGGTVSLPAGTTVATANFGSAGTAAQVTPSPLVITNQLTFNGGASAAVSNGNTFTYATSGGNLANTSAANTLTMSGGVLTFSPSLSAGSAINVFVAGAALNLNYSGTGPSPDTGTTWNRPATNTTTSNLVNSSGGTTAVSYTSAASNGTFNTAGASSTLLSAYSYGPNQMFTFGGLTPGAGYNLYAINNSNTPGRATTFTTGGTSQTVTTQANWATATFATSPALSCEFAGLIANASGQITVASSGPAEVDVNGFQLVPINVPTGSVNLPSTNIAVAANSAIDFSGAGPANAVGGLSLGGNVTVQNVVSGGSVQFGGDVVTSANATVSLAAGSGSVPVLILSGNTSGIQNISAANATTLILPAASISAPTVKVGNSTGYNGSVVLSGPMALTNGGGATVNVNAGTFKINSTLSGAAGANVQVNTGTTLIGGPGASIQVPVTVNGGGIILPDATAASTALIGSSLSINGGGELQWLFNNSGAKGTIALGSSTLNLPANGFGQPFFRPQFFTAPALGTYVMTWNSPPTNQPAWLFDGSLVGTGATAIWSDSNGLWDTGSNWTYPNYTGGTLSYQPSGLQLTGLSVTNIAGTSAPATGANVLIAPPSVSNVSVTGPANPASIGALLIEGSNSATASLTLQSGGPLSPASVAVFAGGALAADADALNMPEGTLTVGQGTASLGSASTNVGAATINSGVLSIGGGNLGILTASGGAVSVSGGTVANAQISGAATVNATGGAFTMLGASGGNTTVGSSAIVGAATVNGNAVVNLNNTNTMTSLIASGGTTTVAGPTVSVATVSGSAVVNVTAGSVPSLNVTSSNLTSGVTVGAGASAGSTELNISGGLVTLNNTNAIPVAALSGGTTHLAGPDVAVANISGNAVVNATAGSVATANVGGGNLTGGPGASVGSTTLSVSGGLVTLNNTNTIPVASLSGGTTTLSGPTVTAANVSGNALVNVSAANSVSGPSVISGGTVNVADPTGLGLQQSTVTVNSNNSLVFSHATATLGGLTGPGSFTLPSGVLRVGANSANTNYNGTLTGAGGLTKVGTGTLQLTSSNAYSGPTLVDTGTLKLASGVTGFGGTGTGWTVNSNANPSTPFTNNVLTLTDNSPWPGGTAPFETRTAWFDNQVPVGSFVASFVYTAGGNKAADGVTFCLQNAPAGLNALGGGGGNLAYNGITSSAAIPLNLYPATSQTGATIWTGGALGTYQTTGSVNIASGDPIQVTLSYNGTNLVENLLDLSNSAAFSTTYAGVNLPALVGGPLAYVGFTGAQGGSYAIQTIGNFNFSVGSGSTNILPPTTALLVSPGATFDLAGANQTVASLSDGNGGGGTVTNSVVASVLTLAPSGSPTTFSGSIVDGNGTVGLTMNGPGTQVLSGTNTYTGPTDILNGTLVIANPEALLDGASLNVGPGSLALGAPVPAPIAAPVAPVPEPGTLALVAVSGLAVTLLARKQLRR